MVVIINIYKMKRNLIFIICIMLCFIAFLYSCEDAKFDESLPINPVLTPIKSVTAQDGKEIAVGVISDKDRTIALDLKNLKSLSNVNVHLSISKRAKLISPTDTILTLDLTKPYHIRVDNLYSELDYTLTASIPEFISIDNSVFKEYRLDNDTQKMEGNIVYLWDKGIMSKPENYGEIGYRNYLTGECFTFDMGDYYHLYRFRASLYWAYTNVCPKKYELWGYLKDGTPPSDGDWGKWTNLGTLDNSKSTLADFAKGDMLEFTKDKSPLVRYLRVKCLENYKNPSTTAISLCEITLWGYNM